MFRARCPSAGSEITPANTLADPSQRVNDPPNLRAVCRRGLHADRLLSRPRARRGVHRDVPDRPVNRPAVLPVDHNPRSGTSTGTTGQPGSSALPAPFIPQPAMADALPPVVPALHPRGWLVLGRSKSGAAPVEDALTRLKTVAYGRTPPDKAALHLLHKTGLTSARTMPTHPRHQPSLSAITGMTNTAGPDGLPRTTTRRGPPDRRDLRAPVDVCMTFRRRANGGYSRIDVAVADLWARARFSKAGRQA